MANNLTRRTMLAASAAGAAWSALVPGRAFALTNAQAEQLVGSLVDEINRAIAAGQSTAQMKATFKRIFNKYADVSVIARSALGVSARSASAGQMQAFTAAFEDYLAGKYGARFNEFKGGTITVNGTQQVKSFYEVTSVAKIPGKSPLDVRWQVSDKSGRDLFFNIIIEGVNMLATERTEIGALLDKRQGNLDQLIRDLPTLA